MNFLCKTSNNIARPFVRVIDVWLDKPVDKIFQKYSQNYHRDSDDYFY